MNQKEGARTRKPDVEGTAARIGSGRLGRSSVLYSDRTRVAGDKWVKWS